MQPHFTQPHNVVFLKEGVSLLLLTFRFVLVLCVSKTTFDGDKLLNAHNFSIAQEIRLSNDDVAEPLV